MNPQSVLTLPVLLASVSGVLLLVVVLWDAFETVLVPRRIGSRHRLTSIFYLVSWRIWRNIARRIEKPSRRESFLGHFAPMSLIFLLALWALGLILGFAFLQMAAGLAREAHPRGFASLLYLSGETFFTLGFGDVTPGTSVGRLFSVVEAGLGFAFLGTVIGYLPTLYTFFSQREVEISLLDGRAGSPPTSAEWLRRAAASSSREHIGPLLREWERWSAQLLETHISYPLLAYYRSQHSNQSWLSALTVMLDTCALILAGLEDLHADQAQLTFAIARHAMVDITQAFVSRFPGQQFGRLSAQEFERLREYLERNHVRIANPAKFESRLAGLRLQYEPYAQALASSLLIELPPFLHAAPRRDNWSGAPWDKLLGGSRPATIWNDDHF